jgi:hypothetical protein
MDVEISAVSGVSDEVSRDQASILIDSCSGLPGKTAMWTFDKRTIVAHLRT